MAGNDNPEAELRRLQTMLDWRIPSARHLTVSLEALERALGTMRLSEYWTGESAELASAEIDDVRAKLTLIAEQIRIVDDVIARANTLRKDLADVELPSGEVDPFWENAVRIGSTVVHPVLGPLAADTALDAIGDFLGGQRREAARAAVARVSAEMDAATKDLRRPIEVLKDVKFRDTDATQRTADVDITPVGPITGIDPNLPGGGGGGSTFPGPSTPTVPTDPSVPMDPWSPPNPPVDPPTDTWPPTDPPTDPWPPTNPPTDPWTLTDPTGPNGPGDEDPTVDYPGDGVIPVLDPPGTGTGTGTGPGGYTGGTTGGTGGTGLTGVVGGGAGAAAIAASSKIAGFGSMGTLGGAGMGAASSAGLKAGGGLLGNTAVAGTGSPAGAAGGRGVGGSGAASGGRPGVGMMRGAGGDDDEKEKRPGLGGPIAPKLEDDEERGPRAKGAQAGSRDDHDL
ncbi:hypothetical protein [Microbacterium sp.]|uniref:hypothetical protein n=1 Tax=Microbacterium sp. TaxID=51671 RepID=UPI0039E5BBED